MSDERGEQLIAMAKAEARSRELAWVKCKILELLSSSHATLYIEWQGTLHVIDDGGGILR